eukprot:TRINITY_DN17736_c0_g1_i1.p1 TRINITY_DN17736_c0_g1~~TRINITY_DN17736_c0_g1_i1.p1  ORF type:complete len:357 (-),score=39.99 TRINITY_DN17736_c0_g1_i1:324-1340(-)
MAVRCRKSLGDLALARCNSISLIVATRQRLGGSDDRVGKTFVLTRSLGHLAGHGSFSRLGRTWEVAPVRFRPFSTVHEIIANGDIPFPRVRVVDDSGLLGDFSIGEARSLARRRGTDIVVLSGGVEPPLCRLVSLHTYTEELNQKAEADRGREQSRVLREFSFDPAMKVKGMRFAAVIGEHDLERKVNTIRAFLEKGHRVEARVRQGRSKPEDVLDVALRICAEVRDLAKPEGLEESVREFRESLHAPRSQKAASKDPNKHETLRLRLWPCSQYQAASFSLPAHVLGPRRRKGPSIVGIDDVDLPEDAWKYNRKPGVRVSKGFTPHAMRKSLPDFGEE